MKFAKSNRRKGLLNKPRSMQELKLKILFPSTDVRLGKESQIELNSNSIFIPLIPFPQTLCIRSIYTFPLLNYKKLNYLGVAPSSY